MENNIELLNNEVDKEQEKLIISDLFDIDGIQDYLKALMAADIKKYFQAPVEQQQYIRGGYDKLLGLLIQIQKSSPLDRK